MGEAPLVAPVFAGQVSRQVVLPAGRWYDFPTGLYVASGGVIEVAAALETGQSFMRDAGVAQPLAEDRPQVPGPRDRVALQVRHRGEAPGRFRPEDDDGTTFDHERDVLSSIVRATARRRDGRLRGSVIRAKRGFPLGHSTMAWKMMSAP